MDTPIRLVIHGANGRMGRALRRLANEVPALQVVALVTGSSPESRAIEQVPCFSAKELGGLPAFDVAIDFSLPAGFDAILALCESRSAALVSGTTGLDARQRAAIDAAATRIPLLWASNFSLGVAVLHDLVARAAHALPGWDCDIVESHHVHKKDAPSGTALTLGAAAAQGGVEVHYASVRAGDIVGEHLVQFAGQGERLELVHRAGDRDIFARGALHAARWIAAREPGRYTIADTLR